MRFMNCWDIDDAAIQRANHPILGPATRTLQNLRDVADANSDGWAYWPKPARAAAKLVELVEGDGTFECRYGDRDDVTAQDLRVAYRPIRAFLTRSGLSCEIVDIA